MGFVIGAGGGVAAFFVDEENNLDDGGDHPLPLQAHEDFLSAPNQREDEGDNEGEETAFGENLLFSEFSEADSVTSGAVGGPFSNGGDLKSRAIMLE